MSIAMNEVLKQCHVEVTDLAERTGLTKTMLWGYAAGRRNPTPENLCLIADALNVSLDMLIRGKEKDRPDERSIAGLPKRLEAYSLPELEELAALVNYLIYRKRREQAEGQGSTDNQ